MADFLGAANLMEVSVRGGFPATVKLGDSVLTSFARLHGRRRRDRARGDPPGAGARRAAAARPQPGALLVERVVSLGAATQLMLRLATGASLQALLQNDGEQLDLAQGSPVHAYLPADALRVLAGATALVNAALVDAAAGAVEAPLAS